MQITKRRIRRQGTLVFGACSVLCITLVWAGKAEVVLEKRLESGDRIKVIIEQRPSHEVSAEERSRLWKIDAVTHMLVRLYKSDDRNGVTLWTNRHFIFAAEYPAAFSHHTALDVGQVGSNLFLCYKEGPVLLVEEIRSEGSTPARERFWLARDSSFGSVWTNAAFVAEANGRLILKAYGSRGATLVWELRNHQWRMDLSRSRPEFERKNAYEDWCLLGFEGDRWVVKAKNTNSLPNVQFPGARPTSEKKAPSEHAN